MRKPEYGDAVIYVDPKAVHRKALVTNVFGAWKGQGTEEQCSINLVYVSGDEGRTDQYGRQTERSTSTPHRVHQMAPGNYWLFPEEDK